MAEEAAESKPKNSNKLVIILLALVVLLVAALGGATAWYFLLREDAGAQSAAEVSPQKQEAIYVKLRTMGGKPYFLANFSNEKVSPQRFLQVYAEARTREPEVKEALEKHMPLIVHSLTTLFSSQSLATVQTAEGKEMLRTMATEKVKEIMQNEINKPGIEEVYFTNFVMQ